MNSTQHAIDTPLGGLQVRVTGAGDTVIKATQPKIQLPPGMSVEATVALLIQISALESLGNVRCQCIRDCAPVPGDPESGECLDAQSWESNGYRVTIGTEDFEALSRRLPFLGLTEAQYPVIYSDQGSMVSPDYNPNPAIDVRSHW